MHEANNFWNRQNIFMFKYIFKLSLFIFLLNKSILYSKIKTKQLSTYNKHI